ncbi:MAG TPA: ATP-binding protein [Patescibacteria group bacterium]|nr:ATP-binding protein [Patescibacteria group bacterium]
MARRSVRTWRLLRVLCVAWLSLTPPAPAAAQTESTPTGSGNGARPIRVLLLYAEDRLLPAFVAQDEALRNTVQSGWPGPVTFHTEHLEFLRRPGEVEWKLMLELLERKYQARRPDLIVASTSVGLRFVLAQRVRLFAGIPVVFVAVQREAVADLIIPPDVTGTWLSVNWAGTLDAALALQPKARQVMVVGGASSRDEIWLARARAQLAPYESRLTIRYSSPAPLAETLRSVASLPNDAIVLVGTYQRDATGREFTPRDVVVQIAKESSVPIYAMVESYVGIGVVGGHVLSPAADGEKAGRLALRVLSGDHPGPPVAGANIHVFDWRQLQRWGLDESRVPAGSVIRFRQPSVWETYRWYIVAVVLIVVAQSALIAGLLVERRQRRQAEAAGRQALEQARRAREELAHTLRVATLGELVAAIAHEMNQPLTAIMTNAEATRRMVDDGSATSIEPVEALADIKAAAVRASQIIQRLRAMARKGPVESREIDLDKLIDETVALLRGDIALRRITILVVPAKDLLPRASGDPIQLQQVLLNLIVNAEDAIATAADGPREIVVETSIDEPGFVHLTVRDTGVGVEEAALEEIFEPFVTTKGGGLGMGLSISRSIVEAHHGRIWATRQWPRGTALHVMLPTAPR